jgi:DUF2950 family protein
MRQGAIAALATAALATGLIACGGDDASESGSSSPEDTVSSYFGAVEDGDGGRICELLTSDSVEAIESFGDGDCADIAGSEDFGDFPDDLDVGEATEDGDSATVEVTGDGDTVSVPLTKEGDDWKVDITGISDTSSSGDTSAPEDTSTEDPTTP